jgi:hypothetical protein
MAMSDALLSPRTFKTAWFAKAARKAKIDDPALCRAIAQAMSEQADDLGGGVYKKRLANNRYRSIILARGGERWVYAYLFAKQDRANIDDAELQAFRRLAALYGAKTDEEIAAELAAGELTEICT